jgi:hypothetical protein
LINLNLEELNLSGRYFSGEIDGQGCSINGADGTKLTNTSGALFSNAVDTTFKNFDFKIMGNLASLVETGIGNVEFNNVNIYNDTLSTIYASADDNNESAYIHKAIGSGTVLSFNNCSNFANYAISADSFGLFLGGYAKDIERLSFSNCVNYGNVKSVGSVGMLIGNGNFNPLDIVVDSGCKNLGTIKSKKQSHLLVSHEMGTGLISSKVSEFDVDERLQNQDGETIGVLDNFAVEYLATVDGSDITIQNKTAEEKIAGGRYELILSAFTSNGGTENMPLLANIVIKKEVVDRDEALDDMMSSVFENVLYGMVDINTYNSTKEEADKLKSIYDEDYSMQQAVEEGIIWTALEGYNAYYTIIDGVYVFDFTGYENDNGFENNRFELNVSSEQIQKVVVVYGEKTNDIDYIADFS